MAPQLDSTILEMTVRSSLNVSRPRRGGMLLRLEEPSVEFYRYLLDAVGSDDVRTDLADQELFDLLQDPLLEVVVLFVGGAPAGMFELDRTTPGEVELARFGLLPGFGGRGLARYLLATAVETAWDDDPRRVWVRVDGDDDPRNLLLYQWVGFRPLSGPG